MFTCCCVDEKTLGLQRACIKPKRVNQSFDVSHTALTSRSLPSMCSGLLILWSYKWTVPSQRERQALAQSRVESRLCRGVMRVGSKVKRVKSSTCAGRGLAKCSRDVRNKAAGCFLSFLVFTGLGPAMKSCQIRTSSLTVPP